MVAHNHTKESIMQRYREYAPTSFDQSGAFLLDQGDWFVAPVGQNRDSECLDQSNFAVMLERLGGESDTVEVHRFGHWGPGWFEIIIIDPTTQSKVKIAADAERDLADYPILDETDYSQREYDASCEVWDSFCLSDKVELCQKEGVSVFQARRANPYDTEIDSPQEALLCH
jgi:hypothetical protein